MADEQEIIKYSGTVLSAPIVVGTSLDEFPTHKSEFGKGGWHEVKTVQDRDNISFARLTLGMAVYVTDTQTLYICSGLDEDNKTASWTKKDSDIEKDISDINNRITEVADEINQTIEDNVVALQQEDTALQNQINTHSQQITQEITDRQTADSNLQTQITTNKNDISDLTQVVQDDYEELKGLIEQETSDRSSADTTLQNNINAEAKTRKDTDDDLQDQIDNLKARGRFLALWDATTGLAMSNPKTDKYQYVTGDYFIVGKVGETNYRPSGTEYVIGKASVEVESEELTIDDVYYFDSEHWRLQVNHGKTVSFANLAGEPSDNTNLKNALDDKVSFTDYANGTTTGVIKTSDSYAVTTSANGYIQSQVKTKEQYESLNDNSFISKGTLENIQENYVTEIGDAKYQPILTAGNGIEIEDNKISTNTQFVITEDMFDLEYDNTKGVAPYNTSYSYTNVTIHDNVGVEWVEGAIYSFVLDTKVATSTYRNVRVRIGESGDWKPVMVTSSIAVGSTVFTKAINNIFFYKTTYQENGALHCFYDTNTTYTLNYSTDAGSRKVGVGTYAVDRYSLIMQKPDLSWEKITNTSKKYSTETTKTVNTNGFLLNQIRCYGYTSTFANGATMGGTYVYSKSASVTGSYSFNCGTAPNWVVGDSIFLVGTIGEDELFYLDTTQWWSNSLPTENDGKLYIQLGYALTTTDSTFSLLEERPILYHDGTSIKEYIPHDKTKQDVIEDLSTIRSNAEAGKEAKETIDTYGDIVTHNVSEFQIAGDYATNTALTEGLATKQDTIEDLETIRTNAQIGVGLKTQVETNTTDIGDLKLGKQDITDSTLETVDKTVVGAVNELVAKIREIELFKSPNVLQEGNPTINNGQVTGFTKNDYLILPFEFNPKDRAFELTYAFRTGTDVTTPQNLFGSKFSIASYISGGKLTIRVSSNGISWDILDLITNLDIQANTTYYIKLIFNKLSYEVKSSTDGVEYSQIGYKVDTRTPFAGDVYIGIGNNQNNPFLGMINLHKWELKYNSIVFWEGMDDAGLGTRADISLSNLDELGEARFNIFKAEYGVTTYNKVLEAYNNGKTVICPTDGPNNTKTILFINNITSQGIIFIGQVMFGSFIGREQVLLQTSNNWIITGYTYLEKLSNKVESITSSSNKDQYPSAKAVYDKLQDYATNTELETKQDVITDLTTIRDGASKGATALQSYTETDPVYIADKPNLALKSDIPDISGKQDKLIPGLNISIDPDTNTISATNGYAEIIFRKWSDD